MTMSKAALILNIFVLIVVGCGQVTKKQVSSESSSSIPQDTMFIPLTGIEEKIEVSFDDAKLKENKNLTRQNIWNFVDEKAEWFKNGLYPQKDTDLLPSDFLEFYEKFNTDSVFQVNSIQFDRLIGVIGECDTTIILNSGNWEIVSGIIKRFNENPKERWSNTIFFDFERVFFEFELIEIGIISRYGFEKLNGRWTQTLYYLNVC